MRGIVSYGVLRSGFGQQHPEAALSRITCVAGEGDGFWLGGPGFVYRFDAARNEITAQLDILTALSAAPDQATMNKMPGKIFSLISDGDFLWISAGAFLSNQSEILLLHKPSGRWVTRFLVPDFATRLAVDDRYLWLSGGRILPTRTVGGTLHRVEKRALYAIRPSR